MQNTFFYATNQGESERQKAVGIYPNGRFGRFVGNNVKANGTHNIGKQKEQAHAFGFIDEGLHSIVKSNNLVGEWAGMCVGLENKGKYALISSNKILATHPGIKRRLMFWIKCFLENPYKPNEKG